MKLRNKKTGEIIMFAGTEIHDNRVFFRLEDERGVFKREINSLAELNEEWEDYEEDELFYVISAEHRSGYQCALKEDYPEICKVAKELGIGFETEKEAEKAVEKLKAWKRLKDKGFRFEGYDRNYDHWHINFTFDNYCTGEPHSASDDLNLLFGGEE